MPSERLLTTCPTCGFSARLPASALPLHCLCGAIVREGGRTATGTAEPRRFNRWRQKRSTALVEAIVESHCLRCDAYPCLYAGSTQTTCTHADAIMLGARCPRGLWGRPKLALLSPCLGMGGAERCLVDIAHTVDRRYLEPIGIGARMHAFANSALVARAEAVCPVAFGEASCAELVQRCDLLLFWGMPYHAAEHAPRAIAYVAHGAGTWAEQMLPDLARLPHIRLAAVSRWAAATFGGRPSAVLHNAVDTERLQVRRGRAALRRDWGVAEHEIVIGYVGRLSGEKNVPAAARAARALGSPYRACYVGPDYLDLRRHVRAEFPEALFVDAVEHVGDVYAAIDVFLLASPSEGFSLALAEAWWLGVPTVATRVGAVPELEQRYGEITAIVPVGATPEQLAGGVRRALSPEHRPVIHRAKSMARHHCTMESYGRSWTAFLLEVFDGSRIYRAQ